MDQPGDLVLYGFHHGGVAVTRGADRDPCEEIEEAVAVYVDQKAAFAPFRHQRVDAAQAVARHFFVAFNVGGCFGSWQRTVDLDTGGEGGGGHR